MFLVLVLEQPRQYINKFTEALKHYKQCLLQYFKFNLQVYLGTMSQLLLLCQNISQKRCEEEKLLPSLTLGKFRFGFIPAQKWWVWEFLVKMFLL